MILALTWLSLASAAPVHLEEVRAASRENVPAHLAALEANVRQQAVGLAEAPILPQLWLAGNAGYSWFGPQLTLVGVPSADQTTFIQQTFPLAAYQVPGLDFSVNVSQLLFDGGKWWSQIGRAREESLEGQSLYLEQRQTSELEGIRRFYELCRVQAAAAVLSELAEVSSQHFQRARALAQAGLGKTVEVAAAEVNLGADLIAKTRSHAALAAAGAALAVWMARDGAEVLTAEPPASLAHPAKPTPSLEEAWGTAQKHRPLLEAVAAKERATVFAQSVASAGYWPTLSAEASAGRQGVAARPVFTQPSQQNYATANLMLRWDLFSGLATASAGNQARYQHEQAALRRQQAERDVRAELRTALVALETQIETAELARKNSEASERAWDLARKHFESGTGSTLEVRDASLKRSQAHLEAISARIDVEIQLAALDRAMGTLE